MCGDSDVIFPLVFNAIGLSSTLQTGPSTNPYVDQRWLSPHLIAGFITPPVHCCPNETGLDLNNGLFCPDVVRVTGFEPAMPYGASSQNWGRTRPATTLWMTFRMDAHSTDSAQKRLNKPVLVSSGDT